MQQIFIDVVVRGERNQYYKNISNLNEHVRTTQKQNMVYVTLMIWLSEDIENNQCNEVSAMNEMNDSPQNR
jgi:hypothetical protein